MLQRAKTWGKEGNARHQALSGKKMILLSHLNYCVSEGAVIPAVKGDSNTLQYWLYPQQASRIVPASHVPLKPVVLRDNKALRPNIKAIISH